VVPDRIPGDVAESMQRLTMIADFRALHMQERCSLILQALQREGIEVILLKGAALAHGAYADFVERPMGDLDLLVPPARIRDAWRIAAENGWSWESAVFPSARYEGHHHLPPLFDVRRTGAKLELHSRLSVEGHPFSLGFDGALEATRRLPAPMEHVRVLDEDYQVLHLAVHFAWSHLMSFGAWRAFRDLAALVATGRVSFDRVAELGRRHRASTCCYWTFRLARHLSGIAIPADAVEAQQVYTPRLVRDMVERHLVTQLFALEGLCPSERIRRAMWVRAISPNRIGQRGRRPWDVTDVELQAMLPRPAVSRRAAYHLGHLLNWWRYARAVVSSGTPGQRLGSVVV
jgi:hypothetical protein